MRRAETIFNGLESIGGFHESLHFIGVLIVFYFRDRLFTSSFLRQLYQVDAEEIPPRVKVPPPDEMVRMAEKPGKVDDNYLKRILDYMLLRTRLTYDYYEIFHFIFTCRCLFKSKNPSTITERRHTLFQVGRDKLKQELDIINIIKNLRQLRLMTRFLLTSDQKSLLKFQRRNVIDFEKSSSDSDNYNYDTIKLMNSKSSIV